MIFIKLPVMDLPAAREFYQGLGFSLNETFSDHTPWRSSWTCCNWSRVTCSHGTSQPKWETLRTGQQWSPP
jgi:hypothetical protein